MIIEALTKFVSLNQGKAASHALLDILKELHESLIQIDIDIDNNDSSSVSLTQKQLRTQVVQLEANLSTENTNQLNIDDLLSFIQAFKKIVSLNSAFIKNSIKTVEAVYLQKSVLVAKKSKGKQRSLKNISVITLFPALAWFIYTSWLTVGSGFDAVSHEIQWPQDAYENSWLKPNNYQYSASYQSDLNEVLSECYLTKSCSKKNPTIFHISQPFFKYNKVGLNYIEKEHKGVVFRSILLNHQRLRPINNVSISVTEVEKYSKGWWIEKLPSVGLSKFKFFVNKEQELEINVSQPIFNVTGEVSYTEKTFPDGPSEDRSKKISFNEIASKKSLIGEGEDIYPPISVRAKKGALNTTDPVYLNIDWGKGLDLDTVNYNGCTREEVEQPVEPPCVVKAYKTDNVKLIEKLPEVIKRRYKSVKFTYQLLDKFEYKFIQDDLEDDVYLIPRYIFASEQLEANAAGPGGMSGNLKSIAIKVLAKVAGGAGLPKLIESGNWEAGAKNAKPEIEARLTVDYEDLIGPKPTLYLNDYLASGGHIEIFGHIKNLPSGRYQVATLINNEAVQTFTVEHYNLENERYSEGEGEKIWGIRKAHP